VVGRDNQLSPRQLQVLALVAMGWSDKEIARSLGLSVTTIKTHLSRMYRHHGFRNRAQAAAALRDRAQAAAAFELPLMLASSTVGGKYGGDRTYTIPGRRGR